MDKIVGHVKAALYTVGYDSHAIHGSLVRVHVAQTIQLTHSSHPSLLPCTPTYSETNHLTVSTYTVPQYSVSYTNTQDLTLGAVTSLTNE